MPPLQAPAQAPNQAVAPTLAPASLARARALLQAQEQARAWAAHGAHVLAVLASRGGPTFAAWVAFHEQQAGARAARQRDLERDLVRAWEAYLATGGKA